MSKIEWKKLESMQALDAAFAESEKRAVCFFKHSTRCSISTMALSRFERLWFFEAGELSAYFLDLIAHRAISDAIAQRTGVEHESPQCIVYGQGQLLYDASHNVIDPRDIVL